MHFDPNQFTNSAALPDPIVPWDSDKQCGERLNLLLAADPLGHDRLDDPVFVLSNRQVSRIVFVSAETGARFARDRVKADPVAWMASPRQLFAGNSAVAACLERDMFIRALLLHGVSASLDMEPADMDLLLEDGAVGDVAEILPATAEWRGTSSGAVTRLRSKRLFTATLVEETLAGISHLFYATIARDEDAVRNQLTARVGGRIAYMVSVEEGFDPSEPIAMSLLSGAMAELIIQMNAYPNSPLSAGFSLYVEHRFDG